MRAADSTDPESRFARRALHMRDDDADALAFALAVRPDRLERALLGLTPGLVPVVCEARAGLTALALALDAEEPAPRTRERLLEALAQASSRAPRRAVLVVDMIHDHLAPGAALEVPRARAIVPALEARLADARRRGQPIVYVVDAHDPDDPDLDAWGTHALRGTQGAAVWTPLAPTPEDLVVEKPSYSAFHATTLDATLAAMEVDTLVLTGCLTEIGLFATATDAMQRGYAVEVPPDSQAGVAEELERATLAALSLMAPYGPARRTLLDDLARRVIAPLQEPP